MLPKHLEYLASDVRCLTLTSRITVKCPCGCVEHQIYVAKRDEADALAEEKNRKLARRKFGRAWRLDIRGNEGIFIVGKGIFGRKKEMPLSVFREKMHPTFGAFVSVKCSACGREHVLFDERIHPKKSTKKISEKTPVYEGEPNLINVFAIYENAAVEQLPVSERSEAYSRIKIGVRNKVDLGDYKNLFEMDFD